MNRPVLLTALFVSLAVNLFGAGAFVGARLKSERSEPQMAGSAPERRERNPVNVAIRSLSPQAQAAWRAQTPTFLAAHGASLREARRTIQSAIQSLGAEPFDETTALSNFERARDLEHRNRLALDRRLVAFAATLSPEDRARFVKALARPRQMKRPGQAAAPAMD